MIYNETFDYLWAQMAAGNDLQATRRLKDYQRKRLKRVQLAMAVRSYFLEASWAVASGVAGQTNTAATLPTTQSLLVLDGAIRTTDFGAAPSTNNNNFELGITRTGGDSRVQPSQVLIKDEHLLTPFQCAIQNIAPAVTFQNLLGHGTPWPLTWPIPLSLAPNELLQVESKILTGGVPAEERTFTQFRCVNVNGKAEDDEAIARAREWIAANEIQRPVHLSMVTEGFRSIVFPDTTATARTNAKTMEAQAPLLVVGYSLLFDRGRSGGNGATGNPKWRLQSSDGWAFSKEEIDCNTFAFAGPGFFYQQFAHPFFLPQGSSFAASFSRLNAPTGTNDQKATEGIDNYVIFRCVTV